MKKVKNVKTGLIWEVPDKQAEELLATPEYIAPRASRKPVKPPKEK